MEWRQLDGNERVFAFYEHFACAFIVDLFRCARRFPSCGAPGARRLRQNNKADAGRLRFTMRDFKKKKKSCTETRSKTLKNTRAPRFIFLEFDFYSFDKVTPGERAREFFVRRVHNSRLLMFLRAPRKMCHSRFEFRGTRSN